MTKKVIWFVVSCLMAISLVMASCGTAEEEEIDIETETRIEKETKEEAKVEEEVTTLAEGPLYGGTITTSYSRTLTSFDPADASSQTDNYIGYTHNTPMATSWWVDREEYPLTEKAGFGSDEATWIGCLAESWETPDPLTIVWHIREGIHWQDKAPVNGREFTADDFKWYFDWLLAQPKLSNHKYQIIESTSVPDKHTCVFTLNKVDVTILSHFGKWQYVNIIPREVIEEYGNYRDWKTHVGTGPFIMTDYVHESSFLFERNPTYFEKDPDGNSLPYVDAVRMLVILDPITMVTALRTGKLDICTGNVGSAITWDQKDTLAITNPELLWQGRTQPPWLIALRNDVEPFDDIRVRKALHCAINYEEMKDSVFGGNARLYTWPTSPDVPGTYTPIEEQPEDIQEWFWNYNPELSRELLAEAGFPTGFATTADYTVSGAYGEAMELLQAYWDDVNVTLELRVHDFAEYTSMKYAFTYENMICGIMGWGWDALILDVYGRSGAPWNRSRINDPWIDEQIADILTIADYQERDARSKVLLQYFLEGCYSISFPLENAYGAWWPWMRNYHGEAELGGSTDGTTFRYLWIDESMKKSMLK